VGGLSRCTGWAGRMKTDQFVHKKNIERYRKLLQEVSDDDRRRQQIVALLAEEEAKDLLPPHR
jgi:hypothetical protein